MPNSCNTICTRQQRDELLPCCYGNTLYAENTMLWLEKWWFVRFHFESHFSDGGREGRRKERKLIVKEGREGEKRDLDTVWKKVRGRGRETSRGFACSDLQRCFRQFGSLLSLYFYKVSRNTSSAIHFISIPTPASHLHSVSFTSPFHFSACHYISWMITYWQFLHWQSTGQDTTLPASKTGGKWWAFFQYCLSSSFFASPLWVPILRSYFQRQPHPPPSTSWANPDLCHMTLTSPCRAWWLPGDQRLDRMSRLSTATNESGAQQLAWLAVMRSMPIVTNSGAPTGHSAFS